MFIITPASPVHATPGCPAAVIQPSLAPANAVSWAISRYQPSRLAGIADGTGETVAVIDSGVDAKHPDLRGRVLRGIDELSTTDGKVDCVAHGTAVAGIILSLAPNARILPVRITERERLGDTLTGRAASPAQVAAGIRWAADHGATIMNMSFAFDHDNPLVRDAIRDAIAHDVVIVAAVGNRNPTGTHTGTQTDPAPFPAAYPGVVGVGGIGPDDQLTTTSPVGPFVDITAPGGDVLAAAPGGGHSFFQGTSFAAPFVTATAALIRQRWPNLTARQVITRILATADPGPPRSGAGVVDPYRAVTAVIPSARSTPVQQPLPALAGDPAVEHPAESWALLLSAMAMLLAGGVLLGAAVIRRGRARHWHTGPLG